MRAVAKGVRRTTSKFGSRLEPFTHVDVQLAEGRNLDTVTQAETQDAFAAPLGADYERYTAGTVMLETAERLVTEEKEPSTQQFLLLVGGLRAMVGGERRPSQVLDSYLLRSLSVAGYAPSFEHCARCGLRGATPLVQPVDGRDALHHLPGPRLGQPGAGDDQRCSARCWPATGRSSRPPTRATSREASGLVAAFLAWHLERGLRSLAYVERVTRPVRRTVRQPTPHPSGARPPELPKELVPRHVAIVMDGNGRWAKERGLPRTKGHEAGESSLFDVVEGAIEIGVQGDLGVRLLDRELDPLARRGPLPHGVQPRRDPAPPRRDARARRQGALGGAGAAAVAVGDQGAPGRRGADQATTTCSR